MAQVDPRIPLWVAEKYKVYKKIGSGSFGEIYNAINTTYGEEVAIKFESVNAHHPQLHYESRVYKLLSGVIGIPYIRWFGQEDNWNVLVMDSLGPSL